MRHVLRFAQCPLLLQCPGHFIDTSLLLAGCMLPKKRVLFCNSLFYKAVVLNYQAPLISVNRVSSSLMWFLFPLWLCFFVHKGKLGRDCKWYAYKSFDVVLRSISSGFPQWLRCMSVNEYIFLVFLQLTYHGVWGGVAWCYSFRMIYSRLTVSVIGIIVLLSVGLRLDIVTLCVIYWTLKYLL